MFGGAGLDLLVVDHLPNLTTSRDRGTGVVIRDTVDLDGEGGTDDYVWGNRSQKFIRCKECGCVMQWKKFSIGEGTNTGVNARNFEPSVIATVKIRLLDGAKTWKYIG